ncbi:MAG: hypothetical protein LUC17_01325 [Oscillospiraceae bacterium]|nr:hypothetical protein [Oscillospiraceae bacterium]
MKLKVRELTQDYKNKGFEEYDGYDSTQMSSSCSKSKNYVKSDVDMNEVETVLDSLCRNSYNTDSLYEMCYYFAGKYYSQLYNDFYYPDDEMYGKAEDGKWYIAFPESLDEDDSEFVEVCFGKTNGWAMPVEYYDFDSESYVKSNFEYIGDLEPAYTRFEDVIYDFKKYGFELDESQSDLDDADGTAVFYNTETGELYVFDTWSEAKDYAYKYLFTNMMD